MSWDVKGEKEEHNVEFLGMQQNLTGMMASARLKKRKGSNGRHEMSRIYLWIETQMDFSPRRDFRRISIENMDEYMECRITLGPLQTEGYK